VQLSKAGYGTPDQILETRVDIVMAAIEYEKFCPEFEAAFIELNREA